MPTDMMHAVRMPPIAEMQHSGPALPLRLLTRGPDYLRRQMETLGSPRANVSAVERLAADKAKYVKSPQQGGGGSSSAGSRGDPRGSSSSESSSSGGSRREEDEAKAPVRRGSSKRTTRPDSLVIYRLKNRGDGQHSDPDPVGMVRRLFQKEKPPIPPRPQGESSTCPVQAPELSPGKKRPDPRSGSGLHRSQSDISSRYSRSFAQFDSFFQYCGLEPEVVEELGRDRFATREERAELPGRIRSVSVATSDSGMSWRSAGEGSAGGAQEDEPLSGQLPGGNNSTTSVVERNARIIKWLYGCKRAKETRGGSPDLP
ncbi:hypothetical protein GDO86_010380 [Hymenochirus boettgeri]|uniref:Family with sequence similarity 110 member C n=1 Tax=Hymenochirus boettgeri TaxID=247094 RepID=A0A8T2JSS7_9PIPI|nr:hypothetical protein GDO86_010380 [Hymenochirus boettgeri]